MTEKLVLKDPSDLETYGLQIVDNKTLLDTAVFKEQEQVLNYWISKVAALSQRPPRPYQKRYAGIAACRPRNLLAHEQGLGKTYETILIILARYGSALLGKQPRLRRGAIQLIVPRHTMELAWLKEFKICGLEQHVDMILSEHDVRSSRKPIWLLDYDFLKRQTEDGKKLAKAGKQRVRLTNKKVDSVFVGKPMWKLIRRVARPHFVAFDEIHMLREGSDRTAAIEHYVRGVKNRLGLTGTPIDGWVEHLATILKIIYGQENNIFPWNEKSFTKRFTRERIIDQDYVTGEVGTATPRKAKAPGINPDQIPEFYRATRHLMHRLIIRDPEVVGQVKFPPVNYHMIPVTLSDEHQAYYLTAHTTMVKAMAQELEKIKSQETNLRRLQANVLQHISILKEAASTPWTLASKAGLVPFTSKETAKILKSIEIASQAVAEGRKVIIYTNQVAAGNALLKAAEAQNLKALRIYADDKFTRPVHLTQDERNHRIETFLMSQGKDAPHVLIGNLGLLATGLTMTEASVIIHHDHDWKANKYRQGNSRVIRPSQVWPHVDVYDLAGVGTIDNYILSAMLRKAKANDELIDRRFSLETQLEEEEVDAIAVAKALIAGDSALI